MEFRAVPPRESIGGTRPHQIAAHEFSKTSYDYLVHLDSFTQSEEYEALDQSEKDLIEDEIFQQTKAYETLWARVDTY